MPDQKCAIVLPARSEVELNGKPIRLVNAVPLSQPRGPRALEARRAKAVGNQGGKLNGIRWGVICLGERERRLDVLYGIFGNRLPGASRQIDKAAPPGHRRLTTGTAFCEVGLQLDRPGGFGEASHEVDPFLIVDVPHSGFQQQESHQSRGKYTLVVDPESGELFVSLMNGLTNPCSGCISARSINHPPLTLPQLR